MKRSWLAPLAPLYAGLVALRNARMDNPARVRRLQWPVVSVGNLSTGGTGKTPFTIAMVKLLRELGFHVDVLSRGYGRQSSEVLRVDPEGSAQRFGDEPLLIARETGAPVYVAASRFEAGEKAETELAQHPGIHLLDDGFQHRQLHRDVDIVLLNRQDWLEDLLLPAGNLREPRENIRRATVLAIPADEPETERDLRRIVKLGRNSEGPYWHDPIWRFVRRMEVPMIGGDVVAFCGIARPEQFFAGLEGAGLSLAARHAFRDHHRFSTEDITLLTNLVQRTGAKAMITTAKDRVRMGKLALRLEQAAPLYTAGLGITFENEDEIAAWLLRRLPAADSGL